MRYLIPLCFCVYSKLFCTSCYSLFHRSSKITLFEITKINSTSETNLVKNIFKEINRIQLQVKLNR